MQLYWVCHSYITHISNSNAVSATPMPIKSDLTRNPVYGSTEPLEADMIHIYGNLTDTVLALE